MPNLCTAAAALRQLAVAIHVSKGSRMHALQQQQRQLPQRFVVIHNTIITCRSPLAR
jgi:hypothetical protein